jgi:anti-sigma B factor antagonist
MMLQVETQYLESGTWVLRLSGQLTVFEAPHLRQEVMGCLEQRSGNVVLDLSAVDQIDSVGVGVLISLLKRLTDRYLQLRLVITEVRVRRVLEITRVWNLFLVRETFPDALATLPRADLLNSLDNPPGICESV